MGDPKPSLAVSLALEAGYMSAADNLAAVAWHRWKRTPDAAPHHQINVLAGDRKVEVGVSPTGRSVRVYVDGVEVVAVGSPTCGCDTCTEIARLTAERDALAEQVQAALALGTIAAAERDALMAGSFDAFRILGFHVDDGDGRWWVPAAEVPETMRQLAAEQRAEYAEVDEANAEMSLALSEARAEAARLREALPRAVSKALEVYGAHDARLTAERDELLNACEVHGNTVHDQRSYIDHLHDVNRSLTAERDALARWKAEAMPVLAEWDEVYVALGEPGALGESKARASRAEAARLREALAEAEGEHRKAKLCVARPPGEPTEDGDR